MSGGGGYLHKDTPATSRNRTDNDVSNYPYRKAVDNFDPFIHSLDISGRRMDLDTEDDPGGHPRYAYAGEHPGDFATVSPDDRHLLLAASVPGLCPESVSPPSDIDVWIRNCTGRDESLPTVEYGLHKHPAVGIVLAFFALVTIFGNVLVIVAVAKERYLRTVTNYFIVSLALADLIIGAVVMPFSISMEITNNFWLFGGDWCDVWHSFDVLASTASILNLSVISLDRYWAIMDPIAYPSKMSVGRAFVLIAIVWIASAAISFPAILWWRAVITSPPSPDTCFFTEDSGYLIFSSMISFYFPVAVISFAYYRIYKAAMAQTRSLKTGSKVMVSNGVNGEAMTLRIHRGGGGGTPKCERTGSLSYGRPLANSDSDNDISPTHTYPPREALFGGDRQSRIISRRKWRNFTLSRKLSKLAKEQKAAKTLGIVMGVFCICWVPFFVSNMLFGVCKYDCVDVGHAEIIFPVFTWLGYINSGMNPVIYALSMRDFRRAFIKTLCCCCPGYHKLWTRRSLYNHSFSSTGCASSSSDRYQL